MVHADVTFRVQGNAPAFWYQQTGQTAPAPYAIAGGRTNVPLQLEPHEAVFLVFRKAAAAPSRAPARVTEQTLGALEGAWDVAIQAGRGAPAKATLDRLTSWSQSSDAGVKYFSGTATYTKTVQAANAWFDEGGQLWLDLGDVKNIAEVTVNSKPLGIVWKNPFRVNVTSALRPGADQITVSVTNLWVNRLIGDQQPGVEKKFTYTTQQFYRADSQLLPSGLIGPVQVLRMQARRGAAQFECRTVTCGAKICAPASVTCGSPPKSARFRFGRRARNGMPASVTNWHSRISVSSSSSMVPSSFRLRSVIFVRPA